MIVELAHDDRLGKLRNSHRVEKLTFAALDVTHDQRSGVRLQPCSQTAKRRSPEKKLQRIGDAELIQLPRLLSSRERSW